MVYDLIADQPVSSYLNKEVAEYILSSLTHNGEDKRGSKGIQVGTPFSKFYVSDGIGRIYLWDIGMN